MKHYIKREAKFKSCQQYLHLHFFLWKKLYDKATLPPLDPIEGHMWFDQISSQWASQKNRFASIYFGKIQFLPPCIWNLPFMSYHLWVVEVCIEMPPSILAENSTFLNLQKVKK
jgi:hypothetical protein